MTALTSRLTVYRYLAESRLTLPAARLFSLQGSDK